MGGHDDQLDTTPLCEGEDRLLGITLNEVGDDPITAFTQMLEQKVAHTLLSQGEHVGHPRRDPILRFHDATPLLTEMHIDHLDGGAEGGRKRQRVPEGLAGER